MLAKRITQALIKDCGVNPDLPLVVGVSGGADSLCLLHCLKEGGFKLVVGHLDHALRESSAAQADALCQRITDWGVPFFSQREYVGQFALQNKLGVEEAARFCRYRFLFNLAREHGAQGVVVGHQADDQVETVLMHFLRGSGLGGLSGMQPRSFLSVIDPELPLFARCLPFTSRKSSNIARQTVWKCLRMRAMPTQLSSATVYVTNSSRSLKKAIRVSGKRWFALP